MSLGSVGEKFELYLTSTYILELLVAEYLHKINTNFYLSLMFIFALAALKKFSMEKDTKIEKEMVEVFKYAADGRKKRGN